MKKHVFLSGLIISLILGFAYAEQAGKPLKDDQILDLVKGNTIEGQKKRDVVSSTYEKVSIRFQSYYQDDGVLIQRGAGGGDTHGTITKGTWWVKKNRLCYQFPHALRDTGKKCRKVVPIGNGSYELESGKGETTHTWDRIIEGNPHGFK